MEIPEQLVAGPRGARSRGLARTSLPSTTPSRGHRQQVLVPATSLHMKDLRKSRAATVITACLRCEAGDSLHRFSVVFHF